MVGGEVVGLISNMFALCYDLPEGNVIWRKQFDRRKGDELLDNLLEGNWVSSSFLNNGVEERHGVARVGVL